MNANSFNMLAKTFKGLEPVLAQELTELGANDVQIERRAVSFCGDKALLYRANLCLRTASRVLVPIANFRAADADAVYEEVKKKKVEFDDESKNRAMTRIKRMQEKQKEEEKDRLKVRKSVKVSNIVKHLEETMRNQNSEDDDENKGK